MFNRFSIGMLRAVRLWIICTVFVGMGLPLSAHAADDFLDPAAAFSFSSSEAPGRVNIHFQIADGYYIYRERFLFTAKNSSAVLGATLFPAGRVKFDQNFQKDVEVYRNSLAISIPVESAADPFDLVVTSQGCADKGLCYPPIEHVVRVTGAALGSDRLLHQEPASAQSFSIGDWYARVTSAEYAQSLLEGRSFVTIIALYFVVGMVLSLLPCSYPMIPILSAIIVGDGQKVTRIRGFALSLTYVAGMALVYTVLGMIAAIVGQGVGAWLQNPWVLGTFGLLLTGLALSLILGFDIAIPQTWQSGISRASESRTGGRFATVAVMGALSALVVGACMTAPLFAVLAFIAATGNIALGGAALFAMGMGLGVPLLVIGVGAGVLLPRAGAWMSGVKVFFGMSLLIAALWIVWPVLGSALRMGLSALWLLVAAAMLGLFAPSETVSAWPRLGRGLGAALAMWGAALLIGLAAGSADPLRPLAVLAARSAAGTEALQTAGPTFTPIHSSEELEQILKTSSRPVMLDFYADWCISCKEMEQFTFTDTRVQARLTQFHLLRADVTANNKNDQALLKRFKLYGPPGIIIFDRTGQEIMRVTGYQGASTFLGSLDRAERRLNPDAKTKPTSAV